MTTTENKNKTAPDQFTVDLADVQRGPVIIECAIPAAMLAHRMKHCEYEATPTGGAVNIKLTSCGDGVLVKGHIEAQVNTQCGTCLANATLNLKSRVSAYMLRRPEVEDGLEDMELTPEDLEKEWFEGNTIVLTELLMDALVLEVPMNPKCGESCPGLPGVFKEDIQPKIDSRFASLASFKIEKEN